jgi:putative colanic acid biosynthesis glycosyltransferase
MFSLKEEAYRNIKDLTIVCPSKWLSDLAKESVLCKHDIRVIPNGIDLSSFYPDSKADVFERFHLNPDQKLVLGVANPWM